MATTLKPLVALWAITRIVFRGLLYLSPALWTGGLVEMKRLAHNFLSIPSIASKCSAPSAPCSARQLHSLAMRRIPARRDSWASFYTTIRFGVGWGSKSLKYLTAFRTAVSCVQLVCRFKLSSVRPRRERLLRERQEILRAHIASEKCPWLLVSPPLLEIRIRRFISRADLASSIGSKGWIPRD